MTSISRNFSTEVFPLLAAAGWYEGRNISEKDLKLPYVDYPKRAKEFLTEFGNLEGKCREQDYTEVVNEFSTHPGIIEEMLEGERPYPYYQKLINKKLYPIGVYVTSAYYLCCDTDCRLYMIGEYCEFLGNSIYEGMKKIIMQKGETLQLDEETGKWSNDYAQYVELPPLE